jgi:5-amino-6-(5-phosphoribosylamino)uracil reductase/diaminohydroxyphosphoribosylaminopyrimidine deaminase/5-amino-6-(5-phosphoribosylamino)uracil reductase
MRALPTVTVSYAQSLDGRIATRTGDSQWISGPETLQLSQELRRDHDGILVGIGTVLKDDPLLTCRLPGCRSPHRIVLDGAARLPPESQIARTAFDVPVTVFTASGNERRKKRLRELGIVVQECERAAGEGGVDLGALLARIDRMGIGSLYVEGGSRVITSFLRARLVDRLIVVIAPLIIGEGVAAVGDLGVRSLADALAPTTVRADRSGKDLVWELSFAL